MEMSLITIVTMKPFHMMNVQEFKLKLENVMMKNTMEKEKKMENS